MPSIRMMGTKSLTLGRVCILDSVLHALCKTGPNRSEQMTEVQVFGITAAILLYTEAY
jgi:hypothetical protein